MMKKIILSLAIIGVAIGGYFAWKGDWLGNLSSGEEGLPSGATTDAIAEIADYDYTEIYENETYGFSFRYPGGFTISSIPEDNGEVILLQNLEKKVGVQILITAFGAGDIDLTADIIRGELPDLKIENPQEFLVGPERKGLAFISDSEAFGGNSREVWFVLGGRLYQISTYAEFDQFLKDMFATWQFK